MKIKNENEVITIEQKAQRYDEALEKAKALYKASEPMSGCNVIIETLFPELAESEDEKIRREIINYFKCQTRDEPSRKDIHNKWISWLERQEGCEVIKKDWLEYIKQSWYKEGFIDGKYAEKRCLEWTQNDATILNELIDFLENKTVKLQHDLALYASWLKRKFYPSEKQGEQKFADSYCQENCKGFQETGKCFADGECKAKREAEQELTDLNEFINELSKQFPDVSFAKLSRIVVRVAKWAKSNDEEKSKVQPKQEWSEEDKDFLYDTLSNLTELKDRYGEGYGNVGKCIDWLKSLRPQNKWKPSELQLGCLSDAIEYYNSSGYPAPKLKELYEQLKKL